jgi:hypothetical protein
MYWLISKGQCEHSEHEYFSKIWDILQKWPRSAKMSLNHELQNCHCRNFTSNVLNKYRSPQITKVMYSIRNIFTALLGFRTLSIVRILIITRKKNKHDVSETGSVSILRWGETPILLGPLERANLNHWTNHILFTLHVKAADLSQKNSPIILPYVLVVNKR